MQLTTNSFTKYIDQLPDKSMMEAIIRDVHKNKKFTVWSITKIFFSQFTSHAFKSIKDGFVYLYKSIVALTIGISSILLFPLIFPIIGIYKIISSKNHYSAGMKYFKVKE